ncbi:hypothetical protein LRAMOSA08073 [Lichtheimia ramosa]|uniref:PB1 domain-containing protein n=1 Tax=Lichtheimia ramosa TaxID=688394 RepID=A0A077WDT3_9FUNG|nr:hypothetical protein LRAMOSA08073 [Lichtheimia ramosa]
MALKLELEQWQHACEAFDNRDYYGALQAFYNMADNAKMYFNIGLIFATIEEHERAIAAYRKSIEMDPYFAVAYFQMGVSYFVVNDMEAARQAFDCAYQKLRGNPIINYQQLGLAFRLYSCEVLFDRGICQLYLGKIDAGLTDLYHAQKSKMTEEHEVIDQAVRDRGKGYSVYSIPPGVLYRPPENRLRQMQGVDMFANVQKIQAPTAAKFSRQNSVLRPRRTAPVAAAAPSPIPPPPSVSPMPSTSTSSSPRPRKDSTAYSINTMDDFSSSTSSFSSSRYRYDGRRIDSGFDEDRYSSASSSTGRNSTRSHKTLGRYSPPPVPPIPRSQQYDTDFDPVSSYGRHDSSPQPPPMPQHELDDIYNSMKHMTVSPQPSTSTSSSMAGNKIKIKVHYSDTRVLLMPTNITFDELLTRIRSKFNAPPTLRLQYKDEDDEMVIMIDDDDLSMARQICKMRNGDSGVERMEIWCTT